MDMEKKIDSIKSFLGALGFEPGDIDAGISALAGKSLVATVNPEEPLMSPKQLAIRLSISTVTLWRMQPPFIKVGARKRFVWSEVEEFLRKRVAA